MILMQLYCTKGQISDDLRHFLLPLRQGWATGDPGAAGGPRGVLRNFFRKYFFFENFS